jgi:hypothetical protein
LSEAEPLGARMSPTAAADGVGNKRQWRGLDLVTRPLVTQQYSKPGGLTQLRSF